jgi:uncharacterized damage-inducible protein DinB
MKTVHKPTEGEYSPYELEYVDLVPDDGQIFEHLRDNLARLKELILAQPEEKLIAPCTEGEWTIKEILVHILDTERVFVYRALRCARNDQAELEGFDQNTAVAYSRANQRDIEEILEELTAVRMASIALFKSFDEEAWERTGVANGSKMSVRWLVYQVAGHELHHLKSIKENYLS